MEGGRSSSRAMAGVRRQSRHTILEPGSARMSLSRPRRGLGCWFMRLACSIGVLSLLVLGGCNGSVAAPSGTDSSSVITAGLGDAYRAGTDAQAVEIERQPLAAPVPSEGQEGGEAKPKKPLA